MKAITLWQPWASLVAEGWKSIETRSWATRYRGLLAIHAGAKVDSRACQENPEIAAFLKHFGHGSGGTGLPTRCVLAIVQLVAISSTEEVARVLVGAPAARLFVSDVNPRERAFGDFSPGRFAWFMEEVKKLEEPVPAKGARMLWDWTPPKGVVA